MNQNLFVCFCLSGKSRACEATVLSVSFISNAEHGTDFYETFLKFIIGDHDTVIRFNFLQSVITTWRMGEMILERK
jgi:hypothetical protein